MDFYPIFLSAFGLVRPEVREASIALNDPLTALLISAFLVLLLSWHFGEKKKLVYLSFAVAVAFLLGYGFKLFLQEERPCVATPGKIPCPLDFSLPSLHALLAFTIAIVAVGNPSFPVYMLYAVFVAFSRVYIGVHTIPQVAAGLALAFFACVLTEIIWRKMRWGVPNNVYMTHDARMLQR